MQPHIREVSCDLFRGGLAVEIVDAERRSIVPQEFVVLIVEPAGIPELEGVALVLRQYLKEAFQPLRVRPPPRGS
jgi:hypothetical protein